MNTRTTLQLLACCALIATTSCKNAPQESEKQASEHESQERTESATASAEDKSDDTDPGKRVANPTCEPPDVKDITAEAIAGDHRFSKPVFLSQPPGANQPLYIVERAGRVLVVEDGEVREQPFLDIRPEVGTGHTERGLLGLAFHPEYEKNGRFFLYYTPGDAHKNVVAEWSRKDGTAREVHRLVEPNDPEDNHNGGMIAFGPDGYLYVGMGDGGGAGDRHGRIGNGQNIDTLFGSILRLDVDAPGRNFAAPDNPFVGRDGKDHIWAYGLRNPWRFSFDRQSGELYIGDVGQNEIEEINYAPADATPGLNFGWRAYEGHTVYDDSIVDQVEQHADPIVTFEHQSEDAPIRGGCSVTGGYVYRGDTVPSLRGAYLYGDFCSQDVAAFRYCDGEVVGHRRIPGLRGQGQGLGSFGEDNSGNVYLIYHSGGQIKRVVIE